jgi:hypothetical protein
MNAERHRPGPPVRTAASAKHLCSDGEGALGVALAYSALRVERRAVRKPTGLRYRRYHSLCL